MGECFFLYRLTRVVLDRRPYDVVVVVTVIVVVVVVIHFCMIV